MSAYVYLLWSSRLKKYYVGSTRYLPQERLDQHNNVHYKNSYTSKGVPWELYYEIECSNIQQARRIESHIKRMKSKQYKENLKRYPKIVERLKERYQ